MLLEYRVYIFRFQSGKYQPRVYSNLNLRLLLEAGYAFHALYLGAWSRRRGTPRTWWNTSQLPSRMWYLELLQSSELWPSTLFFTYCLHRIWKKFSNSIQYIEGNYAFDLLLTTYSRPNAIAIYPILTMRMESISVAPGVLYVIQKYGPPKKKLK